MGDEAAEPGAAANLGAHDALDPSPSSPALVKLSNDRPGAAGAECTISEPSEPSDILFRDKSREQVAAELQPHLAAAEERVSKVLQHVVLSVETRLVAALRQAAIDIVEKFGKEASACLAVSERKAAVLGEELNGTKQRALAMLMRLKNLSDTQIADAEKRMSIERRRAQEAEANLHNAHESIKRLKAELKQKGQLLEELQRSIYSEGVSQGLQTAVPAGSDGRRRGGRVKGPAAEILSRQTLSIPYEPVATGFPAFGRFGFAEYQSPNTSIQPPVHTLTYLNAFNSPKIQMGMPAIGAVPREKNFQATDSVRPAEDGHMTEKEPNNMQEKRPPTCGGSLFREGSNNYDQTPKAAANSHTTFDQFKTSPSSLGQAQHQSSQIVDSESRLMKESDEDKSCSTIEALHCNESLPTRMQLPEEDHSNVEMEPHNSNEANRGVSDHEADISMNCMEKLEFDESPARSGELLSNEVGCVLAGDGSGSNVFEQASGITVEIQNGHEPLVEEGVLDLGNVDLECSGGRESSETKAVVEQDGMNTEVPCPETVKPESNRSGPSSPILKSISRQSGRAEENKPETPGSDSQVIRRKRKQSVLVPKYDCTVTDRNSKRLEEDGAVLGAFDHLLAAAGVDTHISSRDNRRLMQGARQLFSLAERKWG